MHQIRATVRAGFLPVMKVSWITSPICLAFAQKFLPEQTWVPFFNIVSFIIGTYINAHTKKKRLAALRRKVRPPNTLTERKLMATIALWGRTKRIAQARRLRKARSLNRRRVLRLGRTRGSRGAKIRPMYCTNFDPHAVALRPCVFVILSNLVMIAMDSIQGESDPTCSNHLISLLYWRYAAFRASCLNLEFTSAPPPSSLATRVLYLCGQ